MKKLLLIAAILGIYSFANAQSFTFGFENHTLNAGDTIQFPFNDTDIQVDYQFTNTSSESITLQVTVNTIDAEGFNVYGVCAGDCVPGNVSPEFTIAPGETYTGCDARIEASSRSEEGLFTVTASNVNNPDDAITVYMRLYRPLAIDMAESANLNTYPNPATSMLNVGYVLPEGMNDGQIVLTNMLGAVVSTMNVNAHEGNVAINVANLPAGVYNVAVVAGNKMAGSSKVVVR